MENINTLGFELRSLNETRSSMEITPAGPVHVLNTGTVVSTAGSNSVVQVRFSEVPI